MISRTDGLSGLGVDECLKPIGLLYLIVEALYVVYLKAFSSARNAVPAEDRAC